MAPRKSIHALCAAPSGGEPERVDVMGFLPTTKAEMAQRGWDEIDIVFVTGDAYVDHPSFGVPLLARLLESCGFRVGIIPQPDWRVLMPFTALGRPRLFFGVSAGAMDSMVAHYTPAGKLRRDDAYTPGNVHGARPNRATIVYTSRLKEAFGDVPVVIGGIEASLRRFAHYDFWEDKVRRSILFDAKADLLVYGMGERPLTELAERLQRGEAFHAITDIPGTARIAREVAEDAVILPSYEEIADSREKYAEAFRKATEPHSPQPSPIVQGHGNRFLVCNPPALPLTPQEMDRLYDLPFTKAPHPRYREEVPAHTQIFASITTHRGCFGGCAFCAIALHQGRTIQSRTLESIMREIGRLAAHPQFRGTITDLGGPTANMYGSGCRKGGASCRRTSCLYPHPCPHLNVGGSQGGDLLRRARSVKGVKLAAVSSGIRYDLLARQPEYFAELVAHHVSGLLKVAPEHLVDRVTAVMHKPGRSDFEKFMAAFTKETSRAGKKQHVVPYLMSGHPGCTLGDMVDAALLLKRYRLRVEQVQDFTPTPGTLSSCMYHTGIDPFSGRSLHVARSPQEKRLQKSLLLHHVKEEWQNVLEALHLSGREDAVAELLPHLARSRGVADQQKGAAEKGRGRNGDSTPPARRRKKC